MRKLVLKMSVSIDGFVGGPNGEIDWLLKTTDEHATNWVLDTIWQAGVHIMGSRTFNDMASYWPFSSGPLAAPMNAIPKILFSRNKSHTSQPHLETTTAFKDASAHSAGKTFPITDLAKPDMTTWSEARIANGDLAEEITRLKNQPGKIILAHGGAGFAQNLVASGLIDVYRLLIHPVALGKGLPLFSRLDRPMNLKLITTTVFSAGTMAKVYQPIIE